MSTKTTIKRIALVAVSALGMGLLSVVPASAADVDDIATASLQEYSSSADSALVVYTVGSLGTRYGEVAIITDKTKVFTTDLQTVITSAAGTNAETFHICFSPDGISTGSALTNYGCAVSRNTASFTDQLPAAFGAPGGTYATYERDGDSSTVGNQSALLVGTHYLYLILDSTTPSYDYAVATAYKFKVTISNPTMTDVAPVVANSNTTYAGRVGQEVSIPISSTNSLLAAGSGVRPFMRFAASITSQPAPGSGQSLVYPTLTAGSATINTTFTRYDIAESVSAGSSVAISASAATRGTVASATGPSSVLYTTTDSSGAEAAAVTSAQAVGTVTFTPVVAGTYSLTVWAESSATGRAALSGSESSKTFTINVASGISTIALTAINSTSSTSGANGALVKVQLKDASGNAATLAPGESVTITPSGSADVGFVNGSAVTSAAGAAYNLSSADFNSSGIAWINVLDAEAESPTISASIGGANSASISLTFKSTVNVATAPYNSSLATGVSSTSGGSVSIPVGASTLSWRAVASTGSYVEFSVVESLNSSVGTITGYTTALSYDGVAAGDTTAGYAAFSVTATTTTTGQSYTVSANNASNLTTLTAASNTTGVLTVTPSTVNAVAGSTNSFTLLLKDLFKRAYASQTITASVAGKNPSAASTTLVTDANGNATFSLTDANTNTAVTDTITFTAGSAITATVSYGTNAVSTVTLTTDDTTASVANDTTSAQAIATGYAGAQGGARTVTATVKNAAGALLAGVPVTFTVSGTGAAVTSTTKTVYTGVSGTASASVYGWITGTYTVTATAGGKSGTGTQTFYSTGNDSVRTVSATANGSQIIGKATDRFGNPVANATLYAKITSGSGNIAGSLTAQGTTDLAGTVTWVVSDGAATVTVSNISFSSPAGTVVGQTGAAKGYDIGGSDATALTAATVGTTTTAETGVGSSYDAAGVATATADATPSTSSDAIDAANEATDAANAATDAANAAAEAADAATAAAQDAQAAVAELATKVASLIAGIKAQITSLTNLVIKIQKKVRA